MVEKPASIAANGFKSAKWDEVTEGRDFQSSDVPLLSLLCQWCSVMEQCIEDMDAMDGQLVYENRMEDMRPLPQIDIMKKASAEIRQINKQLGICDEAKPEPKREVSIIHVLHQDRQSRAANRFWSSDILTGNQTSRMVLTAPPSPASPLGLPPVDLSPTVENR